MILGLLDTFQMNQNLHQLVASKVEGKNLDQYQQAKAKVFCTRQKRFCSYRHSLQVDPLPSLLWLPLPLQTLRHSK